MPEWLAMVIGIPLILALLGAFVFMAVASLAPFAMMLYGLGLAGAVSAGGSN